MTVRQHRAVLSLGLLAGVLAVAVMLVSLYHLGVAHAQGSGSAIGSGSDFVVIAPAAPVIVAVDPIAAASGDVADLGTILVQYGPIWGGAILLFALVAGFLKKNESKHWLAQGRALALITTAAMGLGAFLKWKFGGGLAAGAGMTPILALLKLFNPLGPAAPGSTTPARNVGVGALLLGGALGFGAMTQPACTGPVPVPITDLIDCVKAEGSADWQAVVAKLSPDVGDWSKLLADVTALAPAYGLHVAECVGSKLISQYLSVAHEGAEATTNSAAAAMQGIRDLVAKELAEERAKAGQAVPRRKVLFHSKQACPAIPTGCDL